MNIHVALSVLFILAESVQSQTCSCICGSNSYYPGTSCSTSSSCASTCYNRYTLCSYSNTRGCCGSQTCVYYSSSSSYYSYNYYNQCNCQCSSLSTSTSVLVGNARMSGCNDTLCKEACNSLYPTTCGVYTNQAYCTISSSAFHHRSETNIFILSTILVYLTSNYI